MNLSRRGFLKSLLATSAIAGIAPAAIDPIWARTKDVVAETLGLSEKNLYFVIHPSWEPIIAEWKREALVYGNSFLRVDEDGPEIIDPTRVFKGELGHIDGVRWIDEEEPIIYKHIEPIGPSHDQLVLMEDGLSPMPTRRMTRAELLSAGFPSV